MMDDQKNRATAGGCCEGSETGFSDGKPGEMFRMLENFCGQPGPFNCGEMMEKFRREDGSVDCKSMMEAVGRMCAAGKEEPETDI